MPPRAYSQSFHVPRENLLARTITRVDGRSYTQTCTLATLEEVAWAINLRPTEGHNLSTLVRDLHLPKTQVNVALEFLKERGCVLVRGHHSYAASPVVYEDALTEFWALAGT